MAFKIIENPTFARTVKVNVPAEGGYVTETLKCTYRVLDPDEAAGFDLTDGKQTYEFLVAIIERLDDIVDEKGKPLEFDASVLQAVLRRPYARFALAKEYVNAIAGARSGN